MKPVRIARSAQADLEAGYDWSRQNWGEMHARAYFEGLRGAIEGLSETPSAWPAADDVRPGLRKMVWRSHTVYFRETKIEIQVLAILHGRRDAGAALESRN